MIKVRFLVGMPEKENLTNPRRMGSRVKKKTPSRMVRGAEVRLQAHMVNPKAHGTIGLCVNAENKDTAKKYLKRLVICVRGKMATAPDS